MNSSTLAFENVGLWDRTLGDSSPNVSGRNRLRLAFLSFRERVALFVQSIVSELPGLTVHDITHLDALWRVADTIIGPDYPINAAEAFVLGGTFLLHDAAHVMAAYPEGAKSIKSSIEWLDFVAQTYGGVEPQVGSSEERSAFFEVVRHLHAQRARELPFMSWPADDGTPVHFIEDASLRSFYGALIGEIAASHHWSSYRVAEIFDNRLALAPPDLASELTVDPMKIAFILRVADAAHIDGKRAPWFLFALKQPKGFSKDHWRFQSRMGQPTRFGEALRLGAGARFLPEDRSSWWLAYDTAKMIDGELRNAYALLTEYHKIPFAVRNVEGVDSPEAFSQYVPVLGWEPIDVRPTITDIPHLIHRFGGKALYGDRPIVALTELLQNGMDAVRAARGLGQLDDQEGHIEASITEHSDNASWLHVTDTGIGMSRFVLTKVLLDFGSSLWASSALRQELPGLASAGFSSVGKFGIGFYSIFMLGEKIRVVTRRFKRSESDLSDQWLLTFDDGLGSRPSLARPEEEHSLNRPGTRVSVLVEHEVLEATLGRFAAARPRNTETGELEHRTRTEIFAMASEALPRAVAYLCPSTEVQLRVRVGADAAIAVAMPFDWKAIDDNALKLRLDLSGVRSLTPLTEADGTVVGRVGFSLKDFSNNEAVVTYRGVRIGRLSHLAGLCLAKANNTDATRTKGIAGGSIEAWAAWAEAICDDEKQRSVKQLTALHPLIPTRDLPIWKLGRSNLTLEALCGAVTDLDELFVYDEKVSHDGEDGVPESSFRNGFSPVENLIEIPQSTDFSMPNFAALLNIPEIDYEELLSAALGDEWQEEDWDEERTVGYVEGSEINRSVKVFRKRSEESF